MTKKRFGLLVLLCQASLCVASTSHSLTLQLDQLRSAEGHIRLALYAASAPDWQAEPLRLAEIAASGQDDQGRLLYQLQDLPAGDYAIRLYHDENGNGQLDRNAQGIPLESFAFSGRWPPEVIIPLPAQAAFAVPVDGPLVLSLLHPQTAQHP
ncbi:MAG TPA: DUF2141 domain-containing protein [Pseudomonadales bacterium]